MVNAKHECSSPYGLSKVDFKRFPSLFLCKIGCARAEPKYDPKGIILAFYIKRHYMMLYDKYECCSSYGLSQVDFKRFPSLFLSKIGCTLAKSKYDPREII